MMIWGGSARAGDIYFDDFNNYSGNQNADQVDTGLQVAYGGAVPGWTGSGLNAIHAVDQGGGNWAIMLYASNAITLNSGIAANTLGSEYQVSFAYGTADYAIESQGTTGVDGIVVEVIRGNDSVLAQETFMPGTWGPGNYDLQAGLQGALDYTGDGTGNVTLQVHALLNDGEFGGSIDNLAVGEVSAPEPGTFALAGLSFVGLLIGIRRRKRTNA